MEIYVHSQLILSFDFPELFGLNCSVLDTNTIDDLPYFCSMFVVSDSVRRFEIGGVEFLNNFIVQRG